jgi:hypothetical protein
MNPSDYFSPDYFSARERFRAAARNRTADMNAYPMDARGPGGTTLSIDTAYLGSDRPQKLLIVCSGTHGVEGFSGSALQTYMLTLLDSVNLPADAGLLLIHAMNPYGFAHVRRANENNVDLNRNGLSAFPGPSNTGYARINSWLNPESSPGVVDLSLANGLRYVLNFGLAAVKQAIAGGQYEFPKGLFYGGREREQSVSVLAEILGDRRFSNCQQVIFLDLHTGLGSRGDYQLLVDFAPSSLEFRQLNGWFGREHVATNHPETSIAYTVSGLLSRLTENIFPNAGVFPIVLEFGTYNFIRVVSALRAENRVHFYGEPTSTRGQYVKNQLLEIFCPKNTNWRRQFLENGATVANQALAALSSHLR